jgi:hypothetical protein
VDTELIKIKIIELKKLLEGTNDDDCGTECEVCPFCSLDDGDESCGLGNLLNELVDFRMFREEMLIRPHNCPLEQEEADMEEFAMFDIEMNTYDRPKKIPDKISAKILGVIKSYSSIIDLTESKESMNLAADIVSVFKEEAEK